jgi:thiaminase
MRIEGLIRKHRQRLQLVGHHPFYELVVSGELPFEDLARFFAQDNLYLHVFAESLTRLARLSTLDKRSVKILRSHSRETRSTIARQSRWVLQELNRAPVLHESPLPTTYAYANHLRYSHAQGFAQGISSLLPCYYAYGLPIEMLKRHGSRNPIFARWIASLPEASEVASWANEITDVFEAVNTGKNQREACQRIFAISTSYELSFLDMVLNNETWR